MTRRTPLLAAAVVLALPAVAHAGPGTGTTLVALDGPAGDRLARSGVRLTASGGAEAFRLRAALPVLAGEAGERRFSVAHRGTLTLRRGGRRLRLRGVEVRLGRRPVLSARVAGARRTVLVGVAGPRARLDARNGTARLREGRVRLAAGFATLLRRRLALPATPRGRAGTLSVDATVVPGGGGTLRRTAAPPRPADAVDVVSATVDWHVRDSFVRYLSAGEGIRASAGATALSPSVRPGSDQALRYDFRLPFARGWYHPATGTAVLTTRGRLRFSYRAHGIDFTAATGQVELHGGRPDASRATFRLTGTAGRELDGRRATLLGLRPGAPAVDGATRSFGDVAGVVPSAAQSPIFAGFYAPGDPFGWMTVTLTTAG